MQYTEKSAQGIELNDEAAKVLDILSEWEDWDGDEYECDLIAAFEEKYSVLPERVLKFQAKRGGTIADVSGFRNKTAYLLFSDDETGDKWEELLDTLADLRIDLVQGEWSEAEEE
jgi:hypothetical protein